MKVIKKTNHFIMVVKITWPSGIEMDEQRAVVVLNSAGKG
jgi:hypothetical protein